ncbi:MAG: hypothetical protein ACLPYS_15500 [Vulcanimicrobiaceae bacterium]
MKALLDEGGFNVKKVGLATYEVSFMGDLREWTVTTRLTGAWTLMRAYVMRLPKSESIKGMLLQGALEINADLPLGKLSLEGDALYLDIEYRAEHLDAGALKGLLQLIVNVGEDEYPGLFRIASGDRILKSLESSLALPKLA